LPRGGLRLAAKQQRQPPSIRVTVAIRPATPKQINNEIIFTCTVDLSNCHAANERMRCSRHLYNVAGYIGLFQVENASTFSEILV
jgi:hypothetical protein